MRGNYLGPKWVLNVLHIVWEYIPVPWRVFYGFKSSYFSKLNCCSTPVIYVLTDWISFYILAATLLSNILPIDFANVWRDLLNLINNRSWL
jgi:hypothetical protein